MDIPVGAHVFPPPDRDLGSGFRQFDPRGKEAYLDQIASIQDSAKNAPRVSVLFLGGEWW